MLLGALTLLGVCGVAAGFAAQDDGANRTATSTVDAPNAGAATAAGGSAGPSTALPLFAYYYIWFSPSSWQRAKIDTPQLGDYSSDDPNVLRQHIEWAKSAGIQGFIVSWKDTATNDRRLRLLMQIAKQEDFKLAMIYQGLDFHRKPLPPSRVAADLRTFRDQYAGDPVFYRIGGKALTIWSGTWAFTRNQVAAVTAPVRGGLLVLSTEKSVQGYHRISAYTDGDAYYWSSVDPQTNTNYSTKLKAMAAAVHKDGKYWIAPFAPGFDARLVGGTKSISRADGQTLRAEYSAALSSSPDVLGLISWNEFSENSYIEPSKKYGSLYLNTVRELRGATLPDNAATQDSSSTGAAAAGYWPNLLRLGGFGLTLCGGLGLLAAVRAPRRREDPEERPPRAGGSLAGAAGSRTRTD